MTLSKITDDSAIPESEGMEENANVADKMEEEDVDTNVMEVEVSPLPSSERKSQLFFGNNTFYVMFRLLQVCIILY
jgi:hypothetical protein